MNTASWLFMQVSCISNMDWISRALELEFGNVLLHWHICHITAIYRSEKYQWNLTRDNIANRKQTKGDNSSARDIQSIFEIQDTCIKSQLAVFIGYR
jgi:hypothetical protein